MYLEHANTIELVSSLATRLPEHTTCHHVPHDSYSTQLCLWPDENLHKGHTLVICSSEYHRLKTFWQICNNLAFPGQSFECLFLFTFSLLFLFFCYFLDTLLFSYALSLSSGLFLSYISLNILSGNLWRNLFFIFFLYFCFYFYLLF